MSHPSAGRLLTAEEFLYLPADLRDAHELVQGRLVVSEPANRGHGDIALNIATALRAFARPRRLGAVGVEVGFVLERNPDTVRGPDVSFLRRERTPREEAREKFVEGHPDLAVEIVSPSNRAGEIARKVAEYLARGTEVVWVAHPRTRVVVVHTPDGSKRMVREPESLDGGDVLPGFAMTVAEVFAED